MRWQGRRESENVEDRRDEDGGYEGGGGFGLPFPGGGGGGFQIPMGQGGGIGIVGLIVIVGIALLLGVDPRVILGGGERDAGRPSNPASEQPGAARRERRRRKHEEIRVGRARGHGRHLEQGFQRTRPALYAAEACAVSQRHTVGMRRRQLPNGAVLLSQRPEGLYRLVLLRDVEAPLPCAGRIRAGLCHRPRDWPSYPEPSRQAA